MNLSAENTSWVEIGAKALEIKPEVFLNAVIRALREELGRPDGTPLPEWMVRARSKESELSAERAACTETRSVIEEATRTARLYLQRIESGRKGEAP